MNWQRENFLFVRIGLCLTITIGLFGTPGCGLTPTKIEDDDSYVYEKGVHCDALLLSIIRQDGSFFGSNTDGDYLFEFNHKSNGPWLLFRAHGLSDEKASTYYSASRVNSTCKEFLIFFDEVLPHPEGPTFGVITVKASRRIKLKGELFYGNLNEGEFRHADIRAKILSIDGIAPENRVKLFIAGRYRNPATEKNQVAAKTLDRMSQERCGLTHRYISSRKEFNECILFLKSPELFTLPPDMEVKN
jgi:hypothetical protein